MVPAAATTWAPGNRSARLAAVNQWSPCAWVAKMYVSLLPTAWTRSATFSAWAAVSGGSTSTASFRPWMSVVDTGAQVRAPPSGRRSGKASGIASDTRTS